MHQTMSTGLDRKIDSNLFNGRFRCDLCWLIIGAGVNVRGWSGISAHLHLVHLHVARFHVSHFVMTGFGFDLRDLTNVVFAAAIKRQVVRAERGGNHVSPCTKEKRNQQQKNQ